MSVHDRSTVTYAEHRRQGGGAPAARRSDVHTLASMGAEDPTAAMGADELVSRLPRRVVGARGAPVDVRSQVGARVGAGEQKSQQQQQPQPQRVADARRERAAAAALRRAEAQGAEPKGAEAGAGRQRGAAEGSKASHHRGGSQARSGAAQATPLDSTRTYPFHTHAAHTCLPAC